MVTPIKLQRFIGVILFKNFVVSVSGFIILLIISNVFFFVFKLDLINFYFFLVYLLFILFSLSIGIGLAILSNRINVYSTVMMILFMPMIIFRMRQFRWLCFLSSSKNWRS